MSTSNFSDGTDLEFVHGFLSMLNSQRPFGASSQTARIGANCSKTRRTALTACSLKECKRTQFAPEKARRAKVFLVCLGTRKNSFRGVNGGVAGCMVDIGNGWIKFPIRLHF